MNVGCISKLYFIITREFEPYRFPKEIRGVGLLNSSRGSVYTMRNWLNILLVTCGFLSIASKSIIYFYYEPAQHVISNNVAFLQV